MLSLMLAESCLVGHHATMTESDRRRTRVAAYALVAQRGQILLCRLSARVSHAQGRWTLPGGGVEFGEDPAAAVVREVSEETGLQVEPHEVLHIGSKLMEWPSGRVHSIQLVYRVTVQDADAPLVHEIDGSTDFCEWHPLATAARLPLTDVSLKGLELLQA